MTPSCVVSFAPGTGGHFVGSVCQHMLHGVEIKIQPTGSCHGNVMLWGHPELLLQHSGEAMCHEMVMIKKLPVVPGQTIVTHSRNLFSLKEKFDKVVYINFSESDVVKISNNYEHKNLHQAIPESNYNNIKDPMWPSYQDFLQGIAPGYVYDEVNQMVTSTVYQDWVWIIPALQKSNHIHKIEFVSIFDDHSQWIAKLTEFLEVDVSSTRLDHLDQSWKKYKELQQNL